MPIRPKNPVAAPATPVVARERSRPQVSAKVIRPVMTSTTIKDIEWNVRGCASSLADRIPGRPHLHIQLRMEAARPMDIEVVVKATGELVDSFRHWEPLEAKYGKVLP